MIERDAMFTNSVKVTDPEAETLELWSEDLWSTKYQRHSLQSAQTYSLEVAGTPLVLKQSPSALLQPGVTGAVVWDGGIACARCLEHWVDTGLCHLRGTRVVDLGSGTGLAGLAAAALGAHVSLTDQKCQLRLLAANAAANSPLPGTVKVLELDWDDREAGVKQCEAPVNWILMADCVYNEEILPSLISTAADLCGPESRCLVSLELRCDATHLAFLTEALTRFDSVTRLHDSVLHPECINPRGKVYILKDCIK